MYQLVAVNSVTVYITKVLPAGIPNKGYTGR